MNVDEDKDNNQNIKSIHSLVKISKSLAIDEEIQEDNNEGIECNKNFENNQGNPNTKYKKNTR